MSRSCREECERSLWNPDVFRADAAELAKRIGGPAISGQLETGLQDPGRAR